jgi:phosphoglycerate dehydrogenase-like enzyme
LKESDYVVICVPFTPETKNLIGANELSLMKPGAFLINSSRGGIVDETALYSFLKEKKIAGAAMDVFATEPPPPTTPLLELDNFIGTPHLASVTKEAMVRMCTHAIEDIVRVLNGQRPLYPVNPEVLS